MPGIFISYRRDDSGGYAGRLYDWLVTHFGRDHVFIDVGTLEAGEDFPEIIRQRVAACNALLAVIGKQWITITDAQGVRRLDNPADLVRLEVSSALSQGKLVIPVLIQGAAMPTAAMLPEPLLELSRRNAQEISDTRFQYDMNQLIAGLEKIMPWHVKHPVITLDNASYLVELNVLTGHQSPVHDLAFSPDGQLMASASTDRTVRLWDVNTLKEAGICQGHTGTVRSLAFAPNGDRLASASDDQTVRIWDTGNLTELARLAHDGPVSSTAFSPDGCWLAAGWKAPASKDSKVIIRDLPAYAQSAVLGQHQKEVRRLAFSPDSRWLATASRDTTVRLWSVGDWGSTVTLAGPTGSVEGLAFSPDGATIATGSSDASIWLWETSAGKLLTSSPAHGPLWRTQFNPDGALLAVASGNQTVQVWDTRTLKQIVYLKGHSEWVSCATFHPSGRFLASCGRDGTVRLWGVRPDAG